MQNMYWCEIGVCSSGKTVKPIVSRQPISSEVRHVGAELTIRTQSSKSEYVRSIARHCATTIENTMATELGQ